MQGKHEEYGGTEQEQCRDKTGPPHAKVSFVASVEHQNGVETSAMQENEKNQHTSTDTERRRRFVFLRNPGQKLRQVRHMISPLFYRRVVTPVNRGANFSQLRFWGKAIADYAVTSDGTRHTIDGIFGLWSRRSSVR
jgi:hypothetical protein